MRTELKPNLHLLVHLMEISGGHLNMSENSAACSQFPGMEKQQHDI